MWDHVKRELGSLPIDHEEMEEVVSSIVQKSQGIFLWVSRAVQEILATAHTRGGVEKALAAIPPEMSEFFGRILDEMSTKLRDTTKRLAKDLLQYTICAVRPLKLSELQSALQFDFGPIVNMEYTIKTVCPHLLRIIDIKDSPVPSDYVGTTPHVQPLHATVGEFLLGAHSSEFAVNSGNAHRSMSIPASPLGTKGHFRDQSVVISITDWRRLTAFTPLFHTLVMHGPSTSTRQIQTSAYWLL